MSYSPQSNEQSNVERNYGCIIYKFGFTQNFCVVLQKGSIKSFVLLERKQFCLIRIQSFPYEKWKERKSNLKYFKVWGYLVKVQDPIPNRMKIGPMTSHCKIRLE